jgi:hypothetical protein
MSTITCRHGPSGKVATIEERHEARWRLVLAGARAERHGPQQQSSEYQVHGAARSA